MLIQLLGLIPAPSSLSSDVAIPAISITVHGHGGRPLYPAFPGHAHARHIVRVRLASLFSFSSVSPRLAFPSESLPAWHSVWRTINIWLLDHGDIDSSVFPSGHVAVAFVVACCARSRNGGLSGRPLFSPHS